MSPLSRNRMPRNNPSRAAFRQAHRRKRYARSLVLKGRNRLVDALIRGFGKQRKDLSPFAGAEGDLAKYGAKNWVASKAAKAKNWVGSIAGRFTRNKVG